MPDRLLVVLWLFFVLRPEMKSLIGGWMQGYRLPSNPVLNVVSHLN